MYSDILSTIITTSDRDKLLSEISLIEEVAFEKSETQIAESLKKVRQSTAAFLQPHQGVDQKKFVKGLQDELKRMSEIKITLHEEPSEELLEIVHNWLIANGYQNVLIDIDIDRSISGGAIISNSGKFFDGSIAKLIDETTISL